MKWPRWLRPKQHPPKPPDPPKPPKPPEPPPARSPADILHQIESSELFAADFPRRLRYSHAEWVAIPEEEKEKVHGPASAAMERLKSVHRELADRIRELGRAGYEPAVPALARLWRDCALIPVRGAAGHALREIGSPAAR